MAVKVHRVRRMFEKAEMPASSPLGGSLPEFGMYPQPAREETVHSDVIVPFAQASITGVLVGSSFAILALLFFTKNTTFAVYLFAVLSVLVTAVVWIQQMQKRNEILWRVESLLGRDFNGDGVVGEPSSLRIELSTTNEHGFQSMEILDLPGDALRFREFACAVLAGRAISLASWTGQGGLYSRREFIQLRDELLKRGWLVWRNPHAPAQGVVLTKKGREAMEKVCQAPHPTERA